MIKITDSARLWLAQQLHSKDLFLAWGEGDANWTDSDKTADICQGLTDLTAEIARRTVAISGYVVADAAGDIETPHGRYRLSSEPTPMLYFKCIYDFSDNPDATVRELGLFMDGQTLDSLPAGQQYFTPSQVTEKGILLGAARLDGDITRNSNTRHVFEFVLPILS